MSLWKPTNFWVAMMHADARKSAKAFPNCCRKHLFFIMTLSYIKILPLSHIWWLPSDQFRFLFEIIIIVGWCFCSTNFNVHIQDEYSYNELLNVTCFNWTKSSPDWHRYFYSFLVLYHAFACPMNLVIPYQWAFQTTRDKMVACLLIRHALLESTHPHQQAWGSSPHLQWDSWKVP